MGAAQGVQSKVENTSFKKMSADESLETGILDMATQLYSNYYQKMNDVELCKSIGLVAADKLEQFDMFTLKKISDKQNSGKVTLKPVFISQNSNQGALFELENMPELTDYFNNKYVSIQSSLNNKTPFTSPYISSYIMNILKYGKDQSYKKPFQKKFKERKGGAIEFIQPGQDISGNKEDISGNKEDISGNKEDISVTDILSKQLKKYNENLEQIKGEYKGNFKNKNTPNKPYIAPNKPYIAPNKPYIAPNKPYIAPNKQSVELTKQFNKPFDKKYQENENKFNLKNELIELKDDIKNLGNNEESEEDEESDDDEEDKESDDDEEDKESDDDEEDKEASNKYEKVKNSKNGILNQVLKDVVKVNKKVNSNSNKKVNRNSNKKINRNSNKKVNRNSNKKVNRNSNKKVNRNSNKKVNRNSNKKVNQKKLVSKNELCKMIARHYMVRGNLVAAIASALPIATSPGFCQSRISALEKGDICLPRNYDIVQSLPMLRASDLLSRYINNFNHGDCESVKGFYKRQDSAKMQKIKEGKDELQRKYSNHVKQMKSSYINSLSILKEILNELLKNPNMTNIDLKILSERTKEVLDTMYRECQTDYILGVITLLQIDYQMPRISSTSMNNLKTALDERAK
jgi:hypothetical protein